MSIFRQFVSPCPCSVFQFDVKIFLGMVAWLPCKYRLLEVAKLFCVFIFLVPTWDIVWSDLHSSVSPAYCSYTWLLPPRPAMYGRCHVYPLQLIAHVVGQLLLLFVQFWWQFVSCNTHLRADSVNLCWNVDSQQMHSQRAYPQTLLQAHASHAAY